MVDSTLISAGTSIAALNAELTGYRVLRQVGHGAMGVVFEAEQISLGRRVAIKVLPPNLALRERTVKRFLREAEAMGRLAHANIVDVFEVGSIRTTHFFSMKFVEGPPLDRVLRAGPLAVHDVIDIGIDVASALAHAHSRGVMHRDIKPGHLLRDGDRVFLTDFGLARPLDSADAGSMTESGDLVGTPLYMSPEQISGDSEHVDGRSDVWGLGVTLYELLLQRAPFQGQNAQGILHAILHRDPPRLSKEREDVPADLEAIVHHCLEKDPARRYPGAAAVLEDLEALRDGRRVSARPPRFFDPALRWMRRHPVEAGVLAGSLLLTIVLAVVFRVVYSFVNDKLIGANAEKNQTQQQLNEVSKAKQLADDATANAKHEFEIARGEREIARNERAAASARYELAEQRMLWLAGKSQGNDVQCLEAEERIFDLLRSKALDGHPEICAEVMQLAASWARARGRPAALVQSELENWIGAVDPAHLLLNRAAILTGLEQFTAALAVHRERARAAPFDTGPRIDAAKVRVRMADDARAAHDDEGFRTNIAEAMSLLGDAYDIATRTQDREALISILVERAHCRLDVHNPVQTGLARQDLLLALREDPTRVDAQSLLMAAQREAEGLSAVPQALLAESANPANANAAGANPSTTTTPPPTAADFESAARGVRSLYDTLRNVLRSATTPPPPKPTPADSNPGATPPTGGG